MRTRHRDCCARTLQIRLDLSPCAKRYIPAKRFLRAHAASIFRYLSLRKADILRRYHYDIIDVFARWEHIWISFRAQSDIFRRKNGRVLIPGANLDFLPYIIKNHLPAKISYLFMLRSLLDLFPYINRYIPSKIFLRSHAASIFGSLSARKKASSCDRLLYSYILSIFGSLSIYEELSSDKMIIAFSYREFIEISFRA